MRWKSRVRCEWGEKLEIVSNSYLFTYGDVLNILFIINEAFRERCIKVLNPRNAMYISRNDGRTNMDVMHNKDTMININALIGMSREHYTPEQLERIRQLKAS